MSRLAQDSLISNSLQPASQSVYPLTAPWYCRDVCLAHASAEASAQAVALSGQEESGGHVTRAQRGGGASCDTGPQPQRPVIDTT